MNACASSGGDAAATAEAIYTSAYHTLSAQQTAYPAQPPAQGGTVSPLLPGSPPPSAEAPTASAPTPGSSGPVGCDNSTFIADVTIPDDTVIAAGAKFVKTWSLQNTGTCAWTAGYRLSYASGDQMGGTYVQVGTPAVEPGQKTDLSVNLLAPTAEGTYTGTWRMQNEAGQAFGDSPYVQIVVGAATACRRSHRATVTIAGDVGPENVTIEYGDGTVVSDLLGKYVITVPAGWSGTVTPISGPKVHPWTFDPPYRTYTNLQCDLLHEKFKATAPPGT